MLMGIKLMGTQLHHQQDLEEAGMLETAFCEILFLPNVI